MITQTELLRMIMQSNPGQTPAFILEQYTAFLKGLSNIHGEGFTSLNVPCEEDKECSKEESVEKKPAKASLTCGFTKRDLKYKPNEAIQRDVIYCCLCGEAHKTITERHLAKHNGITREGYRKLCNYDANQPLMSERHLARMKSNVAKAQEARKSKKDKDQA